MKTLAASAVRENFSTLLDIVQSEPVCLQDKGQDVAVVLSPSEFQRLSGSEDHRGRTPLPVFSDAERSALIKEEQEASRALRNDPREHAILNELEKFAIRERRRPATMKHGDIFVIAQRGIYEGKPRPAVVVQADEFLGHHSSVLFCLLTSELTTSTLSRTSIEPADGNGLSAASQILIDKIVTVRRGNIGGPSVRSMRQIWLGSISASGSSWVYPEDTEGASPARLAPREGN